MRARKDTLSAFRTGTGILRRFLRDRRAVAAVEFAFIAPILLCLYFVTMEVSQGIETNKKVGRIGSMVADLVTQQVKVDADTVDAIMKIGGSILAPYNRSKPEIVITAIQLTGDEHTAKADVDAVVAWSRKLSNGNDFVECPDLETKTARPKPETKTAVPDQLKIPGTFLIRVESALCYQPVITWSPDQKAGLGLASAFSKIPMSETYYLRPRMSKDIGCDNCNK